MKLITMLATGATVLAVGGGLFAAQAAASPTEPTPLATAATATPTGDAARRLGIGGFYAALTDVQRTCLADAALQRPSGTLTEDQRATLQAQVKAALASCGVTLPARLSDRPRIGFGWAALTSEQQHCLAATKLTRPVGRLTEAERSAVRQSMRDAARSCGIG
jgi:hypothetical protein